MQFALAKVSTCRYINVALKCVLVFRNIEEIQGTLKEMIDAIVLELLQPNQNGLVAKSD